MDNHVLSRILMLYFAPGTCMRKLKRIIGDPLIDHVREIRNDWQRIEDKEKEREKRERERQ